MLFPQAPYTCLLLTTTIDVVATAMTPVTCLWGTPDGRLQIQVNNYLGDYDYQVF